MTDGIVQGVLSGATGGIGAGTLTRMVQNLHDSTFYVLGRSETKFASQKAELMKLNPSNKIIFLNAQVSLLKDIDAACEHIKKVESKVDFVYMSPGVDMGTALLMGPQCKSIHAWQRNKSERSSMI
jgi:NADP-dependent 3-hydroxy acid dehydrogenase YdfG